MTIDLQEAIDALNNAKGKDPFGRYELQNIGLDWGIEALKALPFAQPEEDKLKKIADALSEKMCYLTRDFSKK